MHGNIAIVMPVPIRPSSAKPQAEKRQSLALERSKGRFEISTVCAVSKD